MILTSIQLTDDKQLVATISADGFGAKIILNSEESDVIHDLQMSLVTRIRDLASTNAYTNTTE
jgi:hypothetical protein